MKAYTLALATCLSMGGCQTTIDPVVSSEPATLLSDEVFPDYIDHAIESEEQVFTLDESAINFVKTTVRSLDDPVDRMETLVRTIFDHSDLNLLYKGNANTTASETFHNRAANCLSMSIMTYAMAKEAGLNVKFQDIQIPEYWTRRDGVSLLNGHINLQIYPRPEPNRLTLVARGLQVDFDPQQSRDHFPKRIVERNTVLSMFYNNKGADALLKREYSLAYAYFRAAVLQDPHFDSPWVNLGFLYRLNAHYELAEAAYLQAIAIDIENLTAWENLARLYEIVDRNDESQDILARVHRLREDNPFYHFILGEQAFDMGLFEEALVFYRKALRLDRNRHEIYFGLAKTYFELGDPNQSQIYMEKAVKRSQTFQQRTRYQGKLAILSASNR